MMALAGNAQLMDRQSGARIKVVKTKESPQSSVVDFSKPE